jgi:hypothetical protein
MSEQERKLGLNEAMFREINERLEELNRTFADYTDLLEIVCECADIGCADLIHVSPAEYERVRKDPTLFIVIPGHEVIGVEEETSRRDGYEIVRKREGDPADAARATDPRH